MTLSSRVTGTNNTPPPVSTGTTVTSTPSTLIPVTSTPPPGVFSCQCVAGFTKHIFFVITKQIKEDVEYSSIHEMISQNENVVTKLLFGVCFKTPVVHCATTACCIQNNSFLHCFPCLGAICAIVQY